jgi:putative two-component system response regulator
MKDSNNYKPTIMIVDDAELNIEILYSVLQEDYNIRVAMDGMTAIEAINYEIPDLILLDVIMPEIDGFEVCRRLKAEKKTSRIPIIFLTSLNESESESKGIKMGAVDFISKPFNVDVVKARINNHIKLKRYSDNLEELVLERTRGMKIAQDATIISMAVISECRDNETGRHIKATQEYVRALSENLTDKFDILKEKGIIELFVKSAPLHDIGKVGVADNILYKPGKFMPEEFEEMKKHTIYGHNSILEVEKVLGENSFLQIAREITLSHHERWDGNGYPEGLIGNEIPLSARIMALADVYDALVTKRVYKEAYTHEKTVELIKSERGTHFDPDVVDAFLEIADQIGEIHRKTAMMRE